MHFSLSVGEVRLHHLAFRTRDLGRLASFYADVLGLPVRKRAAERVWLAAEGADECVIMLERADPDEPAPSVESKELVAFAVTERALESWVGRLQAAGVALEGRTQSTLYFRDPDGRRVAVSSYAF